jgi:hypothetical protein
MSDADFDLPDDPDAILELMRKEGLQVVHSLFATIHHRSERRPDGYRGEQLDEISDGLANSDVERWKAELRAHFAGKTGGR